MRLLHLDSGRTWRGGQQQVYLLHRELCRRDVESHLLTRGELLQRCRREGLPAERLPGRGGWSPAGLVRVLRAVPPETIVHAHDSHALALGAVDRALRPGCRLVGHRRVSYPVSRNPGSRWKYARADAWIAVSTEVGEVLQNAGVPRGRITVVHSAVDVEALRAEAGRADVRALRAELSLPEGAPIVGFCGAFSPQKGHGVLAAAARRLLEQEPGVLFLLPGEGGLRAEVEAWVEAHGLGRSFRFPGFRRDVAALTSLFTVAVVPSVDGEGSSAAIKEPMALGVPVVVSDLPGNVEVVAGAGAICAKGDPEVLAGALMALLRDPERRGELGRAGWERAMAFTPGAMTSGALAVYRRLAPAENA